MANGRRHELLGTAISGAVRFLNQVNLASREREPGSRLDHYRVPDDAWYAAAVRREQMLARWECGSTGVRPGDTTHWYLTERRGRWRFPVFPASFPR